MIVTRFLVKPLWKMTGDLAAVASGRMRPDLVITGARLLSTYSERMYDCCELWIKGGRIAAVKSAGSYPFLPQDPTRRVDVQGGVLAPGLVDAQADIEGSMLTACAYAEAALLAGTTTVFCGSRNIANVLDHRGVYWFMLDTHRAPMSVYTSLPGVFPSSHPDLETTGGVLTPGTLKRMFTDCRSVHGLGEKDDALRIWRGEEASHEVLAETLRRGKTVAGRIGGYEFIAACAASGMTEVHGAESREFAEECLEAGLWVCLRGASPGRPGGDLGAALRLLTELGANPKRICLCTGARRPDELQSHGLDHVVRQAIAAGVPPATAWSMASLNPATRHGLDGEFGGFGHGRRADLVLLDDQYRIVKTWYGGELLVENGHITPVLDFSLSKRYRYPRAVEKTVKSQRVFEMSPPVPPKGGGVANVLGLIPGNPVVEHRTLALPRVRRWNLLLPQHDLCLLAVAGRYRKSRKFTHGLLQGLGLKNGAIASTLAHDAHNTFIAGTNAADMSLALRTLKASRGGICLTRDKKVLGLLALPVAGLMSKKRAPDFISEWKTFLAAWSELGCAVPPEEFCRLSQTTVPELRLTDKGLVKVADSRILPFYVPKPRPAPKPKKADGKPVYNAARTPGKKISSRQRTWMI